MTSADQPSTPTIAGFYPAELSVVLAIIAGIVYMSMVSGVGVLATPKQAATQQKMKAIEDALMQFRTANDRLPCPPEDFVAEQLNRLQRVHLGRHPSTGRRK